MAARLRPLLESAVRTPPPHAPPGAARFGRVRVVVVASEAQAMSFPDEAFLEDPWFEVGVRAKYGWLFVKHSLAVV